MVLANRKRNYESHIYMTAEEKAQIEERMKEADILNMNSFMLKMALSGYIFHIDLSEIHEMIRLLRNATGNLNQIAKRTNETRNFYATDVEDLRDHYNGWWEQVNGILQQLAKL
jgi:hypothetical protein